MSKTVQWECDRRERAVAARAAGGVTVESTLEVLRDTAAALTQLPAFPGERDWLESFERDRGNKHRREVSEASQRVWVVLMASPTVEVAETLLRGGSVPYDRLDQTWARRFGWL